MYAPLLLRLTGRFIPAKAMTIAVFWVALQISGVHARSTSAEYERGCRLARVWEWVERFRRGVVWLEVERGGRVSVALSFFRGFDGVTGSWMRRGCSTTQAGVIPTGKTFKTKPGRSSRALYSRQLLVCRTYSLLSKIWLAAYYLRVCWFIFTRQISGAAHVFLPYEYKHATDVTLRTNQKRWYF